MTPPRADDFADRELCPDGACIGVIGADGRCKECGAAGSAGALVPPNEDEDVLRRAQDARDEDVEGEDDRDDEDEDEDDEPAVGRALCLDEACIGLIGPDGICRECGKPGPQLALDPRERGLRTDEEVADQLATNIAISTIPRADPDFDDRTLCADEACIGVVGRDGRCRVCGA